MEQLNIDGNVKLPPIWRGSERCFSFPTFYLHITVNTTSDSIFFFLLSRLFRVNSNLLSGVYRKRRDAMPCLCLVELKYFLKNVSFSERYFERSISTCPLGNFLVTPNWLILLDGCWERACHLSSFFPSPFCLFACSLAGSFYHFRPR